MMTTVRPRAMRCRCPPDKVGAAFADDRVVAFGQFEDEVVRAGEVGGWIARGHVAPVEHRGEPALADHQVPRMKVAVNAGVGGIGRRCDRILTIERGRLVEDGSHDELIRTGGRYASLHRLQSGIHEVVG